MFDTKTRTLVVVGAQWGDEGKGKLVDVLAERADWVVRYQGGANAGHTVHIGDAKFILRQIPSGILHAGVRCAVGNGVVLDPDTLFSEVDRLVADGIDVEGRLYISDRAHLVLPYHKLLDGESSASKEIGTTGRGIGPAYEDKVARRGVRVLDLRHPARVRQLVERGVEHANGQLARFTDRRADAEATMQLLERITPRLLSLSEDVGLCVHQAIESGAAVLLEGAQGSLLDIDHGTYPFVTSSNTTSGGAAIGAGIAPMAIDAVLGVVKAYTTRVGHGPLPTEIPGALGERIRELGNEFGAVTGRPRRCGWFDGPAARYATMINALDSVVITKIDVLDVFDEIPFCVDYKYKGSVLKEFPADISVLAEVQPVYKNIRGWKKSLAGIKQWSELPTVAQDYLKFLSDYLGIPISMVSTGPGREETIHL